MHLSVERREVHQLTHLMPQQVLFISEVEEELFTCRRLLFVPAGCCVTYSRAVSLPLMLAPLDSQGTVASHLPGWLLHGFSLLCNLLKRHRLLMRRLVVVLPLVAPPSCFHPLVVASPLITPPPPLNRPSPHLAPALDLPFASC